jgi:hypothetical protein
MENMGDFCVSHNYTQRDLLLLPPSLIILLLLLLFISIMFFTYGVFGYVV